MRLRALRELWREPLFPALLRARLISQAADGLFQASLVSAVVFDPTHRVEPARIATGFVVLLLPYSLVGPFVGVFLDRWHRQRVLSRGALVHAGFAALGAALLAVQGPDGFAFTAAALAALSVNRFFLAALSAALPHVVAERRLVLANAVSPTAGTVVTVIGGLAGLGVRAGLGRDAGADAVVALIAAGGYLLAAAAATRLPLDSLGPATPDTAALRGRLAAVGRGMVAGALHVAGRPAAARALSVVTAQRLLYGLWTVMTVLLFRNAFHHGDGVLRSGLTGLGQVVTAGGAGLLLGAAVTPWAVRRIGKDAWIVAVTLMAAGLGWALEAPWRIDGMIASAAVLGFATQATKVCVDTIVQEAVDDEFRGRVFSFYDTLFNVGFVAAAVVAAGVLPLDGRSTPAVVGMAIGYAAIAAAYAGSRRVSRRVSARARPAAR